MALTLLLEELLLDELLLEDGVDVAAAGLLVTGLVVVVPRAIAVGFVIPDRRLGAVVSAFFLFIVCFRYGIRRRRGEKEKARDAGRRLGHLPHATGA